MFYLTQEQLLYQVTLAFKYLSVVPLGIIFLLTTNPSEFASSVSGVGVALQSVFCDITDPALLPGYFARLQ